MGLYSMQHGWCYSWVQGQEESRSQLQAGHSAAGRRALIMVLGYDQQVLSAHIPQAEVILRVLPQLPAGSCSVERQPQVFC